MSKVGTEGTRALSVSLLSHPRLGNRAKTTRLAWLPRSYLYPLPSIDFLSHWRAWLSLLPAEVQTEVIQLAKRKSDSHRPRVWDTLQNGINITWHSISPIFYGFTFLLSTEKREPLYDHFVFHLSIMSVCPTINPQFSETREGSEFNKYLLDLQSWYLAENKAFQLYGTLCMRVQLALYVFYYLIVV